MQNARLIGKVKAYNTAHQEAMNLHARLTPIFKQLIGQKILKVDGSFLAKVQKLLPEHTNPPIGVRIYRHHSNYMISYAVNVCVQCEEHACVYAESYVNIGELNGDILKSVVDAPVLRTDYTVEEIEAKRKIYKELEEKAREAKYALNPFGEYDN